MDTAQAGEGQTQFHSVKSKALEKESVFLHPSPLRLPVPTAAGMSHKSSLIQMPSASQYLQ